MFYFQASDAVRVDTASAVAVIEFLFGKGRAVCMTGDENDMFFSCKGLQPLFCCLFSRVVFCGAGGIKDSVMLQGLPEISAESKRGKAERSLVTADSKEKSLRICPKSFLLRPTESTHTKNMVSACSHPD